jgi:hypothetical protein
MYDIVPYAIAFICFFGIVSLALEIISAIRTGETDVWMGASNVDDHYGLMLRIVGMLAVLGFFIHFASELPELFSILEQG